MSRSLDLLYPDIINKIIKIPIGGSFKIWNISLNHIRPNFLLFHSYLSFLKSIDTETLYNFWCKSAYSILLLLQSFDLSNKILSFLLSLIFLLQSFRLIFACYRRLNDKFGFNFFFYFMRMSTTVQVFNHLIIQC